MTYKHLLVAVDNAGQSEPLLGRAQELARGFGARLSVISVVASMPVDTFTADPAMPMAMPLAVDPQWSADLREEVRGKLAASCSALGVAESDVHVVEGMADFGILDTARSIGADLIVVGHRNHSGFFSKLFSHTDQSVVGKSACDVLTVVLEAPAT